MRRTALSLLCPLVFLIIAAACDDAPNAIPNVDPDSVVYRGNGGDPGSLDPALAEDIHAFNILTDLYEGLIAISATGDLLPGVAESWAISDDGLTYTFTLRDDARWSNGDPVTPLDFVNAFRRIANPDTASVYGFLLEPILHFADVQNGSLPMDQLAVTAIGARNLEIRLARRTVHFLAILTMPIAFPTHNSSVAKSAFSDVGSFIGNGAYSLMEHSIGGPTRLRRSPTYWDADSVAIENVIYLPVVDPGTELNLYRSGDLDITNTLPSGRVRALSESMPDQVRIAPSLALYYLAFDLTEPPFDNASLRGALNMAIDREKLVSVIGRGEQPAFGIVPDGVSGHVGSRFPWQHLGNEERLRQARALYLEAGYDEDSPLKIKYTYDAGDVHEKIALAVSSMWHNALGVEVTLEKKEWQYFLETRNQRPDWQVMRFAWFGDYNHASTFTNIFRTADPQNLPAYRNPVYDRLLANAASEADPSRHGVLLTEAESVLLADHPIAPLYFYVSKHLVRPGIGGFENNVLDRHPSKYLILERPD